MTDVKKPAPVKQEEETEQAADLDLQVLLIDLFKGLKKFWWLVLTLGILAGAALLFWSMASYEPAYRAEATFTVATTKSRNYGSADYSFSYEYGTVSQMAETFPYILRSDVLQEIIKEDLGVTYLDSAISARGVEDTNLFTLTVTGPDPARAYDTLMSVIKNYPKVAEYIIGDTRMTMLAEPSVSSEPVNSVSWKRTVLKGFLVGAFLGCVVVLLYALTRTTVRKVDDIEQKLNQPVLGVIPRVSFKRRSGRGKDRVNILNDHVGSAFKEAVRALRTRLINKMDSSGAKVLMVTSTLPGEGKSIITLNLALSMAQTCARVALIDADLRRQHVQELIRVKMPDKTLMDVMNGTADVHDVMKECMVPGFYFLAGGTRPEGSIDTLRSRAFRDVVGTLRNEMDFIIIDTPPCGLLADASALAGVCDCALYVIKQDDARVSQILDGLDTLSYNNVKITGCVLNDAKAGIDGYGFGFGYGARSGYSEYGNYGSYGEKKA